jgi:hypothetical protein
MANEVYDDKGQLITETLPIWKKRRYLLVLLVFFGFINVYTLRINLSVGIVGVYQNYFVEYLIES